MVLHKLLFLKMLGSDLRSGGLNRSLLHEIAMRMHWKYSWTPKPAQTNPNAAFANAAFDNAAFNAAF